MSLEGLNGSLESFSREDAVAPKVSVKPELGEDSTTTPGELEVTSVKEEQVEEEGVKQEDVDPTPLSPRELTTLDYKSSWFKPELSLPPPSHLHTLDNGKSLFDVDFHRQPNDIGGNPMKMISEPARNVCCSSWHAPQDHVGNQGGPYYVLSSDNWKKYWRKIGTVRAEGDSHAAALEQWERLSEQEKKGKTRPEGHDGSVSLFYGGRANTWRYRGDVKVHEQIDILPEDFAKMGEEERLQWINYFRFENVTVRLNGRLPGSDPEKSWVWQSPKQFFEYLSKPKTEKLVLTILKVVGYNQERIEGWMEKRRERLAPSLERSVAPTPAVEEKKPKKRKTRSESSSSASEVEEEKPFVRVTRSKSDAPPPDNKDKKPKIEAIRRKSSTFTPFVAVPERSSSKLVKREP